MEKKSKKIYMIINDDGRIKHAIEFFAYNQNDAEKITDLLNKRSKYGIIYDYKEMDIVCYEDIKTKIESFDRILKEKQRIDRLLFLNNQIDEFIRERDEINSNTNV